MSQQHKQGRLNLLTRKLLNQTGQGGHLSHINQLEFVNEEEEVLENSVQVSFFLLFLDTTKVVNVDEGEDTEQALEDSS